MILEIQPTVGSNLTLENDGAATGYSCRAIDLGNVAWEHAFSGPRGTQGATAATGTPQNRTPTFGIRILGSSKDNLSALTSTLQKAVDNLRRFGGKVKYRSNNQTWNQYFDVMTGQVSLDEWSRASDSLSRANFAFSPVCGPYVLGDAMADMVFSSQSLPAVLSLTSTIPGDAGALLTMKIRTTGGAAAPIWALVAFWNRASAALAGSVAPVGIIEAETGTSLSTWASVADANYRGGNGIRATTSGVGTSSATYAIDPSTIPRDDYTLGDLSLEVWGRVELASTVVSPKLTLSVEPSAGTSFGQTRYTDEWQSAGKLLVLPSSGTRFRFVRLGTLQLVSDPLNAVKWNMKVAGSWAAGSSGSFGLDYLCLVPSRRRALSPTSKANDSTYPKFISSTSDTTKTILPDLSARVASAAGTGHPDQGLGGALLELPFGSVDALVKLSSLVPDDFTVDATSEQLAHTGSTVTFSIVPRWAVLRDAA